MGLDESSAAALVPAAKEAISWWFVPLLPALPLSAIGFHPPTLVSSIRALAPHILLVGPAISLAAARRAQLVTLRTGSTPRS